MQLVGEQAEKMSYQSEFFSLEMCLNTELY